MRKARAKHDGTAQVLCHTARVNPASLMRLYITLCESRGLTAFYTYAFVPMTSLKYRWLLLGEHIGKKVKEGKRDVEKKESPGARASSHTSLRMGLQVRRETGASRSVFVSW